MKINQDLINQQAKYYANNFGTGNEEQSFKEGVKWWLEQQQPKEGSIYYKLFLFFNQEHNLILLDSEIQEIIYEVEQFIIFKNKQL